MTWKVGVCCNRWLKTECQLPSYYRAGAFLHYHNKVVQVLRHFGTPQNVILDVTVTIVLRPQKGR